MENDKFQSLVLEYMAKLTQEMTELKQGQTRLELIIENGIKPKIDALFEGQKQHTEILESHTERLERIEEKVGKHDIQISVLNNTKNNRRRTK